MVLQVVQELPWSRGPARKRQGRLSERLNYILFSCRKKLGKRKCSAIDINTNLSHNELMHGLNALISFFSEEIFHIITSNINTRFSACKAFSAHASIAFCLCRWDETQLWSKAKLIVGTSVKGLRDGGPCYKKLLKNLKCWKISLFQIKITWRMV